MKLWIKKRERYEFKIWLYQNEPQCYFPSTKIIEGLKHGF